MWDAWTVGVQWWRRFGQDRILHGTAHDMLMATPGIGAYFRRMGVLPAAPDSIAAALAAGRDVALWPGGEVDSLRPWTKRDEAVLAGRKGFIRMAINSGVPIVPIATVGGPDAMPVIASGRRIARLLKLDQIARLKMFPIALSAPWGISPAILPEIPLPTKIRTAFQPPVELDRDPAKAEDDDYVDEKYEEVRQSIQDGMDPPRPPPRVPRLRLEAPADAPGAALCEVPVPRAADVAAHPPALPCERPNTAWREGQRQGLAMCAAGDAASGATSGVDGDDVREVGSVVLRARIRFDDRLAGTRHCGRGGCGRQRRSERDHEQGEAAPTGHRGGA